jgi:hypothetical protein
MHSTSLVGREARLCKRVRVLVRELEQSTTSKRHTYCAYFSIWRKMDGRLSQFNELDSLYCDATVKNVEDGVTSVFLQIPYHITWPWSWWITYYEYSVMRCDEMGWDEMRQYYTKVQCSISSNGPTYKTKLLISHSEKCGCPERNAW